MGADLSYVNHIQDKGAEWREDGQLADPYELFAAHGGNCARFRIWHDPQHTMQVYIDAGEPATQLYHDFHDVKTAMERAKAAGLAVYLDFHYSDFWADPGKQYIPAAWEGLAFDQVRDSIYAYTYSTLVKLDGAGLMPEYVQVGNEINPGFVHPFGQKEGSGTNLAVLLNSGIKAVRDAGSERSIAPRIIIHIAQPQNVEWWFDDMVLAGVTDFDIIGFSYYRQWSDVPLDEISAYVSLWKEKYNKEVMCVETSYPRTLRGSIPDQDELAQMETDFYPSVSSQKNYFISLAKEIIEGGGLGLIPWEPFWVQGQRLVTSWGGVGTHMGNRSYFEYSDGNEVQASIDWMNHHYEGISGSHLPGDSAEISIMLNVPDSLDTGELYYVEGDFTAQMKVGMNRESDTSWSYSARLPEKSFQLFRFYQGDIRDSLPGNYRIGNSYDRGISVPDSQRVYSFTWKGGPPPEIPDSVSITFQVDMRGEDVAPEGVYIYGNFLDQWGPRMLMVKICDSAWTKTITLKTNTEYWFRFFNGFDWENSEIPPAQCRFGDKNRVFLTTDRDRTVIYAYNVCGFTECNTCGHEICDVIPSIRSKPADEQIRVQVFHESVLIRISYPGDFTRLKIYDVNGRLLYQLPLLAEGASRIETGSWDPGVYLLSFSGQNMPVSTKKVAIYH